MRISDKNQTAVAKEAVRIVKAKVEWQVTAAVLPTPRSPLKGAVTSVDTLSPCAVSAVLILLFSESPVPSADTNAPMSASFFA